MNESTWKMNANTWKMHASTWKLNASTWKMNLRRFLSNHPSVNKLKQTPLPIPSHTRMQVLNNTCDTRAYSRAIEQYK